MYVTNYLEGKAGHRWEDVAHDAPAVGTRAHAKMAQQVNDRRRWLVEAPLRVDDRFVILPVQSEYTGACHAVACESAGPAKPGTFGRWQRFPMERFIPVWLVTCSTLGADGAMEQHYAARTSDPFRATNRWFEADTTRCVEVAEEWQAEWKDRLECESELDDEGRSYSRSFNPNKPVRRRSSALTSKEWRTLSPVQVQARLRTVYLPKATRVRHRRPSELGTDRRALPESVTGTAERVPF
jgi:hypothetical protein